MRFNLAIATLVLSLGAPASRAALIFSENFDALPQTTYTAPSAVGNFTATSGSVDVLGPAFFGNLCTGAATVNCVDLNGNTQGALSSGILVLAPGTYTLAFVLNGSQRNGLQTSTTVQLGAAFSNTYVLNAGDTNSFSIPITVVSAQSAPLTFTSNTPGAIGAILDTVTLDSGTISTAPTPEPSASWLVGMGLVATSLLSRRLRKA